MHKLSYYCCLVLLPMLLLGHRGQALADAKYSRYDFPDLYTFDDYDKCFRKNTSDPVDTTYCMVYAEIKPDNSSELWLNIINHSETNKFHYRYDRLFFGLCMERCKQNIQSVISNEEASMNTDFILRNEFTEYFEKVHNRPLDIMVRANYSYAIKKCLNDEFQKKYNLQLQIFVKYCEGRNELQEQIELAEKDPAEIFLYKLMEIISLLVVLSTLYDYCLKKKQTESNQTNEFYKNNLEHASSRLLTSFSICRNYYRLLQPYRGEIGNDFAFLDGYRVFTTLCVVYGHVFYTEYIHIGNPEYFDIYTSGTAKSMIMNGMTAIEIFMVMSGLFSYLKFVQSGYIKPETSVKKCIKIYLLLVASRYLRYIPSVGLLLLVNATTASRLADGPFWRHIIDHSRSFSRENWWKNVFMINNFSQKDTMGPHTWYIAADIQLFALYAIVIILMVKYPKYKSRIMIFMAACSVLIPTIISYVLKIGTGFVIRGESFRMGYFFEPAFNDQYIPFYNNLGGYLFGIYCGELYLKHLRKPEVQQRVPGVMKYELGAYSALVAAIGISWLGSIMMFMEPSLWTAIYCGLHRNIWIVIVCGMPLLGMVCKAGWVAYEFCRLPIFRVLARLSFQIYLWHFLIMQTVKGHIRQPFHMNTLYFGSLAVLIFVLSTILAFVIALVFEYPFAQLLETLQAKKRKSIIEDSTKDSTKIK